MVFSWFGFFCLVFSRFGLFGFHPQKHHTPMGYSFARGEGSRGEGYGIDQAARGLPLASTGARSRRKVRLAIRMTWDPNWLPPEIPISAGAMLFNQDGHLLILKPTYKDGWTIPGGAMEADGETPWEACQREVYEETGLSVTSGRLAAVDSRPAKARSKLGVRFLFDCGVVTAADEKRITLQPSEISEYRFAPQDEAMRLLRKAVRRRVKRAWHAKQCVYLENGREVDGVNA